jgi:hypothetical protein
VTADDYLRRVSYALSDLPWKMRRDLISELRAHLNEVAAEPEFQTRLGTPEQYAADLRAAAGLERRRGPIAFLRARRLRNVIATVVALTLIGLAIGAVIWIDSYQPLASGNFSQLPAGAKGAVGIKGESVVFHEGTPFTLGMEIVNTGRFTVRVLGVPYEPIEPWTARLLMGRLNYTGIMVGPYARFHPFDLKSSQRVFLVFKGVFACHTGGSSHYALTLEDFPVRYSFLWRTSTAVIPLPEELGIDFPNGCTHRR